MHLVLELTQIVIGVELSSHPLVVSGVCRLVCGGLVVGVVLVWMQVAQGLVQLVHKHIVVSLTEVFVRVASELIVAVHHATDALHDPLSLINWADNVLVAVEYGDWNFIDGGNRDIGGDPAAFASCVLIRELLESVFDTVLEVVLKGLG